jgi:hypothetical protein
MDQIYRNLTVTTVDNVHQITLSDVYQDTTIARFRLQVALRLSPLLRSRINGTDIELMAFGESLVDDGMCIRDITLYTSEATSRGLL